MIVGSYGSCVIGRRVIHILHIMKVMGVCSIGIVCKIITAVTVVHETPHMIPVLHIMTVKLNV